MNYASRLRETARAYSDARAEASLKEAKRDDLIRRAHREGGMSTREISQAVGLSFQRVATVVAGDRNRPFRATLHGAMQQVLNERGGDWMPAHQIARVVYERDLYRRKDQGVISPGQIRARASKYPELFEGTDDGSNRVRLHQGTPAG